MKWITRSRVHVDRVACPWLIKRFVDSEAAFIFVARSLVAATAQREEAIPFDVEGVELGHRDGHCGFVSILDAYGLSDPALRALGEAVDAADTGRLDAHPYAQRLEAAARGFSAISADDARNLELQFPFYDALYASFRMEGSR